MQIKIKKHYSNIKFKVLFIFSCLHSVVHIDCILETLEAVVYGLYL